MTDAKFGGWWKPNETPIFTELFLKQGWDKDQNWRLWNAYELRVLKSMGAIDV